MNFTKDQLLALMNTIDFATDNDASYEEYTILKVAHLTLNLLRIFSIMSIYIKHSNYASFSYSDQP